MDLLIYFDLETTGINHPDKHADIEIISIGATCKGHYDFSVNIMPQGDIQPGASMVNKITKKDGKLWFRGCQELPCVGQEEGIEDFVAYVEDIVAAHSATGSGGNVYLVAHNNTAFDSFVLCHSLVKYNFWDAIQGVRFLDSMPAFRSIFKTRRNVALRRVIGYEPAHDSVEDSRALRKAVEDHARQKDKEEANFLKGYCKSADYPTVAQKMQACQEIQARLGLI